MKRSTYLTAALLFFFLISGLISCRGRKSDVPREEKTPVTPRAAFEEKDEGVYITRIRNGKEETELTLDFSGVKRPASPEEFTKSFYWPPIQQNKTDACWCFATTSLFEAERHRLGKPDVKLSEMHTVYWEFVEKARQFVKDRGSSDVRRGSEPNAVIARMKQYGAVRESDYTGLLPGKTEHDHYPLYHELFNYLQSCKKKNFWNEKKILARVMLILDKHLGKPPAKINVDGTMMSPKEYLDNVLQIPFGDYVCIISFKYLPFFTKGDYRVPDNWFHSRDYFNVPLDEFYGAILGAVKRGFTVAVAGDISEPGNSGENNLAIIPSFDIPYAYVDQESREFRFDNKTSTDDHTLHLVGYKETPGEPTWFLIKDSWETAYRGQFKGFFFYREDYIKLKTLAFLVHKDAVPELLGKFSQK